MIVSYEHVTGGVTAPAGFTASGVSCGIRGSWNWRKPGTFCALDSLLFILY